MHDRLSRALAHARRDVTAVRQPRQSATPSSNALAAATARPGEGRTGGGPAPTNDSAASTSAAAAGATTESRAVMTILPLFSGVRRRGDSTTAQHPRDDDVRSVSPEIPVLPRFQSRSGLADSDRSAVGPLVSQPSAHDSAVGVRPRALSIVSTASEYNAAGDSVLGSPQRHGLPPISALRRNGHGSSPSVRSSVSQHPTNDASGIVPRRLTFDFGAVEVSPSALELLRSEATQQTPRTAPPSAADAAFTPPTQHHSDLGHSANDTFAVSTTALTEVDDATGLATAVNDIDLFDELGRGAYGRVMLGVSPRFEQPVAVKEVRRANAEMSPTGPRAVRLRDSTVGRSEGPSAEASQLESSAMMALVHEAEVLSRLQHPNIVALHEVVDDPAADAVYLVMQYVQGRQAAAMEAPEDDNTEGHGAFRCARQPAAVVELVAHGAAAALAYCHRERKVVHGDVKPENILLQDAAPGAATLGGCGFERAMLTDFGVALTLEGVDFHGSALPSPVAQRPLRQSVESWSETTPALVPRFSVAAHGVPLTPQSGRLHADISFVVPPAAAVAFDGSESVSEPVLLASAPTSRGVLDLGGPMVPEGDGDTPAQAARSPFEALAAQMGSGACGAGLWGVTPVLDDDADDGTGDEHDDDCDSEGEAQLAFSRTLRGDLPRVAPAVARGTPAFLAPELLVSDAEGASAKPTPATDCWALGVTLFALKYGRLPFRGATRAELARAIREDALVFPTALETSASFSMSESTHALPVEPVDPREERKWRALLRALLDKDPARRLTAEELRDAAVLRRAREFAEAREGL